MNINIAYDKIQNKLNITKKMGEKINVLLEENQRLQETIIKLKSDYNDLK